MWQPHQSDQGAMLQVALSGYGKGELCASGRASTQLKTYSCIIFKYQVISFSRSSLQGYIASIHNPAFISL